MAKKTVKEMKETKEMKQSGTSIPRSIADVSLREILERGLRKPSLPIAIVGNPGCGKTAQIKKFARDYGLLLIKKLTSSLDETDTAGIVVREGDSAVTLSPDWGKRLGRERGILFLDEVNTGRKEVTDTLLTIVQDRELPNGDKLHPETMIIAAMNDGDQCDNYRLNPAFINRFFWYIMPEDNMDKIVEDLCPSPEELEIEDNREYKLPPVHLNDNYYDEYRHLPVAHPYKIFLQTLRRQGLKISKKDEFTSEGETGKNLTTSRRSLLNLFYWSDSVEEVKLYAPCLLSQSAAHLVQFTDMPAVNNIANSIFANGRLKTTASDDETAHLDKNQINAQALKGLASLRVRKI